MPATAPITDANPTVAEMEARVARFLPAQVRAAALAVGVSLP